MALESRQGAAAGRGLPVYLYQQSKRSWHERQVPGKDGLGQQPGKGRGRMTFLFMLVFVSHVLCRVQHLNSCWLLALVYTILLPCTQKQCVMLAWPLYSTVKLCGFSATAELLTLLAINQTEPVTVPGRAIVLLCCQGILEGRACHQDLPESSMAPILSRACPCSILL